MKKVKLIILIATWIGLSGFNFASQENTPQDCRYINAAKARSAAGKYVTGTSEITGWYVCQGERSNLNDIQIAELSANAKVREFRVKYLKENVNDAKKARYSTLTNFAGAQVLRGTVSQTTNPNPIYVDFYFLRKAEKTYVLIYKDNKDRYQTTKVQSRAVIAEILQKLNQ